MKLICTRDGESTDALNAVIEGIAKSGGLFVPGAFPRLTAKDMADMAGLPYDRLSARILHLYFDELSLNELEDITKSAYATFDTSEVAPIVKLKDQYILELWHGATLAFKDVALSFLPRILSVAKRKKHVNTKTLVLVATSGDTGKAALDGFKDVPNTEICVFYPEEGVSALQRKQMVTQDGENTHVFAVKGNFDDAQTGVKKHFC